MICRAAVLCCAILLVSPVLAQTDSSESQNQWDYKGAIYLWGASLGGRTLNGSEVEVGFSQLVDSLEMGFMGAFEARKDEWSILADVIYLDLGAGKTVDLFVPVGPVQIPVTTATDLELALSVLQLAGGYGLRTAEDSRLDLVGGIRYLDIDMDLFLELDSLGPGQSRTVSESLTALDGVIGLKGRTALSERWYLPYYIDIGAGDSKLTWQAIAGLGFQAGRIWDVTFVYRHIEWDLDSTRVIDDIYSSGPTLGVIFRW